MDQRQEECCIGGEQKQNDEVKSFRTEEEVDEYLLTNPMHSPRALHFKEQNETMCYGLQTNSTTVFIRGKIEDPTFKFQLPLQLSAERKISRFLIKVARPEFQLDSRFDRIRAPSSKSFHSNGVHWSNLSLRRCYVWFCIPN
ncbi:ABC transporter A family member 2-like isoform X2 [Silene latifolia]|uniref:ABC transporter A family member 2-like isoform X2 n=1 Tax=Silene latifolia TaxID=37657 RepID=UPI003D78539E